jgi:thiol-disulfide isomerase/thioredoxin
VKKNVASGKLDSTWFANENLPNNRPIVIIYFSPECSHCIHEINEIKKNIDSLSNAFFVMASYHNLDSIKVFATKYSTSNYKNMVVGRDTKYFLPVYYDIKFTPFIAVYDTQKNFVKAYDQGANMHELIELVNAKPTDVIIDKKSKKKHTAK